MRDDVVSWSCSCPTLDNTFPDWSQVVYSVRMFAKVTWYHIPDVPINGIQMAPARNLQEYKARMLVEKKTVLNLLEGFA